MCMDIARVLVAAVVVVLTTWPSSVSMRPILLSPTTHYRSSFVSMYLAFFFIGRQRIKKRNSNQFESVSMLRANNINNLLDNS